MKQNRKQNNILTMKKILFLFALVQISLCLNAQEASTPTQNISSDNNVEYRLFATKNMYTFIKLNTRNGKLTQIQWGTENKYRFESILSDIPLVNPEDEKNGRFFLYPTTNIYNLILLDQISGKSWQVQWGKADERMVMPIN